MARKKSLAELSAQWEPPESPPQQQQARPTRPQAPRVPQEGSGQRVRRKRSIYLDDTVAADYDDALWSLHAKHRANKGRVQDALLRVALDHLDEVDEHLGSS